jgi:hypothetical protein
LSCVNLTISAQVVDKRTKEIADSTYHKTGQSLAEAGFEQKTDSLSEPLQTRSCVSTFTNQTVSSIVSVTGCNTLTVQNITVTGSGTLSLIAPSDVTINGVFDVLPGGVLIVQGESIPVQASSYTYTYDAAGNRTARLIGTARSAVNSGGTNSHEIIPLSDNITNDSYNNKKE